MSLINMLGLALAVVAPVVTVADVADEGRAQWESFRDYHPYHVQAIALSELRSDGSRVLVVSEPPPHVSLSSLQGISSKCLVKSWIATHAVGHDGRVKDVVFELPRECESQLSQLLSQLHAHVFRTTYKAYTLDLGARPDTPPTDLLDISVSAGELNHWLSDEQATMRCVEGGPPVAFESLFEGTTSGVYINESRGLVVWIIPCGKDGRAGGADIDAYQVEARQFVLDADLVLGAIKGSNAIAIVGRERVVPVDILPPLRTEIIMLLASVQGNQLHQSYERNHFLAGSHDAASPWLPWVRERDWAPILLSPELIDTEYGSLLNLTDQLLKSWSNCGLTHYHRFEYPAPAQWPFDGKPLPQVMGASEVTYNWNTRDVGYVSEFGEHQILAFDRTGALAISYLGENELNAYEYETEGHKYFATLNNADLARVVQYAALYQIFRTFDINATSPQPPVQDYAGPQAAQQEVFRALTELREWGSKELPSLMSDQFGEGNLAMTLTDLQALINRIPSDRSGLEELAWLVANPRESENRRPREELLGIAQDLLENASLLSELCVDRRLAKKRYASACQARQSGWIRTASIVLSWNRGLLSSWTGGHNIHADPSSYRPSSSVPRGEIRYNIDSNGKLILILNPRDMPKADRLLKDGARIRAAKSGPERRQTLKSLETKLDAPARYRPPKVALGSVPQSPETGLCRALVKARSSKQANWRPLVNALPVKPEVRRVGEAFQGPEILIERRQDHFVVRAPGYTEQRASTIYDAIDAFAHLSSRAIEPGQGVRVRTVDFDRAEVAAFRQNAQVRSGREFVTISHRGGPRAGETADALLRRYDWNRAELSANGNEFRLEIPCAEIPIRSLGVRIKVILQHATAAVKRTVGDVVRRFLGHPQNRELPTGRFLHDLHEAIDQAIKGVHPGAEYQLQLEIEALDFQITEVPTHERQHCEEATEAPGLCPGRRAAA